MTALDFANYYSCHIIDQCSPPLYGERADLRDAQPPASSLQALTRYIWPLYTALFY